MQAEGGHHRSREGPHHVGGPREAGVPLRLQQLLRRNTLSQVKVI